MSTESVLVAHKFGGSSVADVDRVRHVARLLMERPETRQVVVVSALKGVTDTLLGLVRAAAGRGPDLDAGMEALFRRHREMAAGVNADSDVRQVFEGEFDEVSALLHAQGLLGAPSVDLQDLVSGMGELWSARILQAALRDAGAQVELLDARDVLVVEPGELGPVVNWELSRERLLGWKRAHPGGRVVATGFIAREPSGRVTTLGRNGSDFSAAILSVLFGARELHIWTDVDGVLSADPRLEPEAVLLPELSYDEALEMAYFGARVLHPLTLAPAIGAGIPVHIRNTFRPDRPGTRIGATRSPSGPVKGLSVIQDLALVNLEGAGMIGVPGTAERVFGVLHRAGVSVVMISQGSSEHSICFVVRSAQGDLARTALRTAFERELRAGQVKDVSITGNIAVLAAVGDGMAGTPGIAARIFGQLARAGVNVRAIAQGASERNVSVAVAGHDARRALRAIHSGVYLSPQTISVGLVGPGNVGRTLLAQLAEAAPRLKAEANLDLRLRAVATSRGMLLDERALDPEMAPSRLAEVDRETDLRAFGEHVGASHLPHAVILDCSASDAVAEHYEAWLGAGIHVVTPNKQAGAGPLARWKTLQAAARGSNARWRYEATVGAGLPVIQTLRDLLDTGDRLHRVEGILSGTLSYLFNRFDQGGSFAELVREARELGFTEPDPRDDLSGLDVARKLVILGREAGLGLELGDVRLESLVPASLQEGSVEDFMGRLGELDGHLEARFAQLARPDHVLRYVATLDMDGSASVGPVALPRAHPFANLKPTDNIVQFTTDRYRENPLIVQGPGAGPEVTAGGVFADLLRVAAALGAPL
jgi:bifunctional aspartokinase / homoserine dehydrogenase 1